METESLIGKQYMPRDNSYSRNLSNEHKHNGLAGIPILSTNAQVTIIKSEPFEVLVTQFSIPSTYLFVLVETAEKETYFVMYHEKGLITETNTIEKITELDNIRHAEIRDMSLYDFNRF